MKIKFIGVPNEKHDELNMYGTTFPLGKWVDLDEKDAFNRNALHKLPRHPHFEVADEAKALKVAASLGDPLKEAQREADADLAAEVAKATAQAEADKAAEAKEIEAQERLMRELAANEEKAERDAAEAEVPKRKPGRPPKAR